MTPPTKQTNMRLSDETRRRLEWLAQWYGMTMTSVVAMLIKEDYRNEWEKEHTGEDKTVEE